MFLYSKWLSLPLPTRIAIAKELGIAKVGSTHVVDNRVESDGYPMRDVEAALERNEKDWDNIVARAEGREVVEVTGSPEIVSKVEVPADKPTRAKPPKKKGK